MEEKYTIHNIQSLTACEAVRLRPNLYFQKCYNEKNLDALPLEIACHAIDEVFDNNCSSIEFLLFDDHFSVKYNAGMSLEKSFDKYRAELIMTAFLACHNQKKHLSVGEEFCELGMATINFASEYCKLTTVSNGLKGIFHYKNGQIAYSNIQPIDKQDEYTEIVIKPDPLLFKDLQFSFDGVKLQIDLLNKKLKDVNITVKNNKSQ